MPEYPEHWGHFGGTATHPPIEWVLSNQIADLEKRLAALESRKQVAVHAQRGGTIIYPVRDLPE